MSKRALVSVSDKRNIVEFCKDLVKLDYEIISTGGTYQKLKESGIEVIPVEEITGFPEILDGRVKTLHPKIHGGLLAVRDLETHQLQLQDNGINLIDLVCVNLYPFKKTISNPAVDIKDAIEQIDIGGPSMIRSSAKNYRYVTTVVDIDDYQTIIENIKVHGNIPKEIRFELAAKAFRHTAAYDAIIANYLTNKTDLMFPDELTLTYDLVNTLRYGENPHQKAAFYKDSSNESYSLVNAKQLNGKQLSYNNIQDTNAAIEIVREFKEPVVVALKHMNPCGIGIGDTVYEAWTKAYQSDKVSIFGGIVATNQVIDEQTAREMVEIFLEVIIAPHFTEESLKILKTKKNLRLLELNMDYTELNHLKSTSVLGGLLVQSQNQEDYVDEDLTYPTKKKPTPKELDQLLFAYKAVKHVKSNAIVVVKDYMTIGVGAGQLNRVGAARIALEQGKDQCKGAVLASDAFFPMTDTIELAKQAGISAIIQPGGSIKDKEVIDKCNQYGISMVFTGIRHFKH